MRILAPAAALAIVTTLLLGGCVPSVPDPSPTPEPTSTPVFASEEEALAAAEAAYAAYLAVSDAIAQEGGANPERLADLVTPEWLDKEVNAFATFAATGRHQVGATTYRNPTLQQVIDDGGSVTVVIYACTDASQTRFLTADGSDVTPPDRSSTLTVQVTFESTDDPIELLLSDYEPWSGDTLC